MGPLTAIQSETLILPLAHGAESGHLGLESLKESVDSADSHSCYV